MKTHTPSKPTFDTVDLFVPGGKVDFFVPGGKTFFDRLKTPKHRISGVVLATYVGRKRIRILIHPAGEGFTIFPQLGGQLVVSQHGSDGSMLLVSVDKAPQTIRAAHRAAVALAKTGKRKPAILKVPG